MTDKTTPDVLVTDNGSLVSFDPQNSEARSWIDENVHSEPWQWLGRRLQVEHRFAPYLIEGLLEAGLQVGT